MKFKWIACAILVCTSFFACKHDSNNLTELKFKDYDYQVGFLNYMENTFHTSTIQSNYVIIPLESCNICVEYSIHKLLNIKQLNGKAIFIGKTDNIKLSEQIKVILSKHGCLVDSNSILFKYETNIISPSVIKIIENSWFLKEIEENSELQKLVD